MQVQTIRNKPKPFAWSYSKLKNFETCPKRHWHVDIKREFSDDSENLSYGNTVHKILEQRVRSGTELPPVHKPTLEPWAQKITKPEWDELHVEQQLAIREDFSPCEWFAKDAWFRAKADVLGIKGAYGLAWDYKTGKIKEDHTQLALMAAVCFSHWPQLQAIRTEFVWLKEDAVTRCDFKRDDMASVWSSLWPRIEALKAAYKTTDFPAKPGPLCRRWCPVKTCPHFGE